MIMYANDSQDIQAGIPAGPLAALTDFWETCVASERTVGSSASAFRYPAAYEAAFDRVAEGSSVPFRDLPIGLQRLLGGRATDVWYALTELPSAAEIPPDVRALASSSWIRRTVPVRDLVDHVLTDWSIHHAWPCSGNGRGGFGLPPAEYTGGYNRLMGHQRFDAPVVFLDGEIHVHAVAYAVALLCFAPDAMVRVLEGTSDPAAPVMAPVAPRWDWGADGIALWDQNDASTQELASDAVGTVDRWILGGHSETIATAWAALGLGGGRTTHEDAVAGLKRSVTDARLPYLRGESGVSREARRAWHGPVMTSDPDRGGFTGSLRRWLAAFLVRPSTRAVSGLIAEWNDAHAAASAEHARGSVLRQFLPEVGTAT